MKPFILILAFACILTDCSNTPQKDETSIKTIGFAELEPRLNVKNDTLYIVNFWATWCAPCVKEIPDFEKVNAEFKDQKVKFLMVSLDFPTNLETKLIPFVREHNMQAEVVLLDDPDANSWIDKVSAEWTGSLPATLIYKKDFRSFHEGSYSYEKLKQIVKSNLKL